jgi:hypothetical protein
MILELASYAAGQDTFPAQYQHSKKDTSINPFGAVATVLAWLST